MLNTHLQQHTLLSKESRNLFIGSLNCHCLAKREKVQQLCQDIEHFKINILAVQETKKNGEEKTDQVQPENGVWTESTWNTILGSESTKQSTKRFTKRSSFFRGKCNNSFHG